MVSAATATSAGRDTRQNPDGSVPGALLGPKSVRYPTPPCRKTAAGQHAPVRVRHRLVTAESETARGGSSTPVEAGLLTPPADPTILRPQRVRRRFKSLHRQSHKKKWRELPHRIFPSLVGRSQLTRPFQEPLATGLLSRTSRSPLPILRPPLLLFRWPSRGFFHAPEGSSQRLSTSDLVISVVSFMTIRQDDA